MGAPAITEEPATYTAVPLSGLVRGDAGPFALYLKTADDTWVLYRPGDADLDESHVGRLAAEGVAQLYIRAEDRAKYYERVEATLGEVLFDRRLALAERADVLYGVATMVAADLLAAPPDRATVARAQKLMMATPASRRCAACSRSIRGSRVTA